MQALLVSLNLSQQMSYRQLLQQSPRGGGGLHLWDNGCFKFSAFMKPDMVDQGLIFRSQHRSSPCLEGKREEDEALNCKDVSRSSSLCDSPRLCLTLKC